MREPMREPVWEERVEVLTPEEMHQGGVRLGRQLREGDVLVLTGALGAGKTTLTRGIGEGLGIRGAVTSPTFVLARTHPSTVNGPPLVHVDAYRLAGADEFDDLDLDFEHSVVVVEWGEGMLSNLRHWLEITVERPTGGQYESIESDADDEHSEPRVVTLRGYGERWQNAQPLLEATS